MIASLLLALAVQGLDPAPSDIPDGELKPKYAEITCDAQGICFVPEALLLQGEMLKRRLVQEVNDLREQLRVAREMKGCGKLEVLPKLKKERDS